MYNHYRSKVNLKGQTIRKRYILLGLAILFGSVLIFGSGFYAGIKFKEKIESPSLKDKDVPGRTDYSRIEKQGITSKLDEPKGGIGERNIEPEAQKSDTPTRNIEEKELKTSEKDLTFYQTLGSKKKEETIVFEQNRRPSTKQEQRKPNQEKAQGKTQPSLKAETLNKTYTIQIGAYKEMAIASKVMNKLKKKGYSAYIITKEIPEEGPIYKVRIGEFSNREEAEEQANSIKTKEKMDAFVTLR